MPFRDKTMYAARKSIGSTLGSADPTVLVLTLALLVALSLALVAIESWVSALPYWRPASVIIFVVVLLGVYWQARRWRGDMMPSVHTDESPDPVRFLVLFLSPVDRDEKRDEAMAQVLAIEGALSEWDTRSKVRGSWRMPLEAIAYHMDTRTGTRRKLTVVVFGSSDSRKPGATEPADNGTYRQIPQFKALVRRLTDPPAPEILSLEEFTGDARYAAGVDFEDINACQQAINDVHRRFRSAGLREADFLVDITGGQKPNSIAGAAAAIMVPNRRFEYVSTRDYKVRAFDVTLEFEG